MALDVADEKDTPKVMKWFFRFICGGIVSTVFAILLPSKDSVYLIAGAKVTQDIVTSPEAKEMGDKVLKIINQKLDEQITEKKEK